MDLKLKIGIIAIIAAFAVGLYTGKQYFPRTVETQTEREVLRKDVVVVTKEIVRPDGTKEIVTTSTDKSVQKNDKQISVTKTAPNWRASTSISRSSLAGNNIYAVTVERRVLSNVFVGVTGNTDKTLGLVLGIEF